MTWGMAWGCLVALAVVCARVRVVGGWGELAGEVVPPARPDAQQTQRLWCLLACRRRHHHVPSARPTTGSNNLCPPPPDPLVPGAPRGALLQPHLPV